MMGYRGGYEPCKVRDELLCFSFVFSFDDRVFGLLLFVIKENTTESLLGFYLAPIRVKPKDLMIVLRLMCDGSILRVSV